VSEPFTPTEAAVVVASVDGDYNNNLEAFVSAIVRNPGAQVVCVDLTLTTPDPTQQTKFKVTIERTSAP
jgi:hypothetical protein